MQRNYPPANMVYEMVLLVASYRPKVQIVPRLFFSFLSGVHSHPTFSGACTCLKCNGLSS